MRLKTLLIILLALPALNGCLGEYDEECNAPDNLELLFTYDDASDEAFTDRITSVDVILFDMQGYYHSHRLVSLSELSAHARMRFILEPGIYYAVAWGNVGDNSGFSAFTPGITTFQDCFLEINASSTETGDPVYYAPYKEKSATRSDVVSIRNEELMLYVINVSEGQKTTMTLDFVRAHRTLNVWIKDYRETMGGQAVYPVVTATQRWSKYDFFFTTQPLRRDYTQQSHMQTVEGIPYAAATFHAALGRIDNNIDVVLNRPSDGGHVLTVNLDQFITTHGITDTDEIDILITFLSDQGITVTVPRWTGTSVQPGVD